MAVTYYELVIKGNGKLLKGFIRGYQIGRDIKSELYFCKDHPFESHHLKEVLTFRGNHVHFICTAKTRQGIISAIRKAKDLEFELITDERLKKIYFDFEFKTASRKVAGEIKRIFSTIRNDLKLVGYKPSESIDEGAKGVEFYTPAHDYRFEGGGRVSGDLDSLLRFHKKLTDHDFIEAEDIVITE